MLSPIHSRPVFQRLLFATCFEDPELDRRALQIRPEHNVICVTSGGCNTLGLLLEAPAKLIALDMNPAQSAMLELKIQGIRYLDYGEYLELLGVQPSARRLQLYNRLPAIPFWDAHPEMIEAGVLTQGRFERYLWLFRMLLTLVQGTARIEALVQPRTRSERERFYADVWDTPQWRALFRVFFSRIVLSRLGLDSRFFDFVNDCESFGDIFLRRTRHALIDLPVHENYFAAHILFGSYRDVLPAYLQPANFHRLQGLLDRVEMVSDEAERFFRNLPDNSIDRINFSNIFEWMDLPTCERLLREVVRVCRPGARMTYRNLLVFRERPESLAEWIRPDPIAGQLLPLDRAFVYSNFVVEEITKETVCNSLRHPAFSYTC